MEMQNMEIAQICEQGSLGNNPRQPRQKAEADSAKKQANNIDNNKERKKEILFKENGKYSHNVYTLCDPECPHANAKIKFKNEE